jgi:hypothetical protein
LLLSKSSPHVLSAGRSRRAVTAATLVVIATLLPGLAAAQDCPTAETAKRGFVVERHELQKTDVSHGDRGIVRTVMRYDGKVLLETTQFEGLFQLDRLDRGQHTTYEPGTGTDLKSFFPLKSGQRVKAKFISEAEGRYGRLYVELDIKAAEELSIGACKYTVLRIDRSQSSGAAPPRFSYTEFYAPDLKLILAREYRKTDGRRELVKFDRIYTIKK